MNQPPIKARSSAYADNPGAYQIATKSGNLIIRPGDTIEIEQYITGYGNIHNAKITIYLSSKIFNTSESYVLFGIKHEQHQNYSRTTWGNDQMYITDVGATIHLAGLVVGDEKDSTLFFDSSIVSNLDKAGSSQLYSELKVVNAPFQYKLITLQTAEPGNHNLDFYFTYFDGKQWVTKKEKVEIKIKTFFERNNKLITWIAITASTLAIFRLAAIPLFQWGWNIIDQITTLAK